MARPCLRPLFTVLAVVSGCGPAAPTVDAPRGPTTMTPPCVARWRAVGTETASRRVESGRLLLEADGPLRAGPSGSGPGLEGQLESGDFSWAVEIAQVRATTPFCGVVAFARVEPEGPIVARALLGTHAAVDASRPDGQFASLSERVRDPGEPIGTLRITRTQRQLVVTSRAGRVEVQVEGASDLPLRLGLRLECATPGEHVAVAVASVQARGAAAEIIDHFACDSVGR